MSDDSRDAFEFDDRAMRKLMNILGGKIPEFELGILGNAPRADGEKTNAEIGAKHEFGLDGMQVRSWLRMPLTEQFEKTMVKAQPFTPQSLKDVIQSNSLLPWVKKMTIVGEAVVQEAFATEGFGKWPKHSAGYTNNTGQVLVDTQQLRKSVTSKVTE